MKEYTDYIETPEGAQVANTLNMYMQMVTNPTQELLDQGDIYEEDIMALVDATGVDREELANAALVAYIDLRQDNDPSNDEAGTWLSKLFYETL